MSVMSDRRKFTLEFKIEAAHRVIDSGRTTADVARELSLNPDTLRAWVADERRRIQAAHDVGEEPLSDPASTVFCAYNALSSSLAGRNQSVCPPPL